ncbi:hypothetical protein Trydic_g16879 [Trypoxylus dichotomus]
MSKFAVVIVYCFTIVAVSAQSLDDLLLAGNYIDQQYPQYYGGNQFTYGPGSTLGGPAQREATPIVEEDTEPPVHFPPSREAVQLDRKTTVVPQPKRNSAYPGYPSYPGDFRYSYNYY